MSGDLDSYFASKRFLKRLDEVRSKSDDPSELKAYAFSIATRLGLKLNHVAIIHHYLYTGIYDSGAGKSSIELIDRSQPQKYLLDPAQEYDIGVAVELSEDTTKDELHKFIDDNWPQIKRALDTNYLGRKKRFTPIRRIDNYLDIADTLNAAHAGSDKAKLSEQLAIKYRMEVREVYRIAIPYCQEPHGVTRT